MVGGQRGLQTSADKQDGRGRRGQEMQPIPHFGKNKPKRHTTLLSAGVTTPHRGAYGTGGGGGMYKSRRAGFSFLANLLAEPQGD